MTGGAPSEGQCRRALALDVESDVPWVCGRVWSRDRLSLELLDGEAPIFYGDHRRSARSPAHRACRSVVLHRARIVVGAVAVALRRGNDELKKMRPARRYDDLRPLIEHGKAICREREA